MDKKARIDYLIKRLNEASDAYYGGREEIMTNYEWDTLFDELAALERETGYVGENSPTQHVSRSQADDAQDGADTKEAHEFPALSLAKTKKTEDLVSWAGDKDVWVSWKLDGLTLVLTYDGGHLTKILTRGNGQTGTNITYFKDAIKGIPLTVKETGHLVIRGEATISYKDFEVINDLSDEGDKFANPRNLAAGTLALDPQKKDTVRQRNVTFVAFSLIYLEKEMLSWGARMDYLDALGFITVERELAGPDQIAAVVDAFSRRVDAGKVEIPVDGLVICYDDTVYASEGSVTGHHATRGGFAFKWQDQVAVTTLKEIEWSCATSVITPVAIFDPVALEGTVVSRASLCNVSELERLGIGENGKTVIRVIKANKIIPKCVGVVEKEGSFVIPKSCPVCQADTAIAESASGIKVLRCTSPACPAKKLSRFARFVSKAGMDVDGLSVKTLTVFINSGFIRSFEDIFDLGSHADAIREMEGFGEKSCANLLDAIEKSKHVPAVHFIFALSIPLIGVDAAKKIIGEIGYDEFVRRAKEGIGFEDVPGIGAEKSGAILAWFADEDNRRVFDALSEILTVEAPAPKEKEGLACEGLTFVITGTLETFQNRDALVAFIEARGGKVASAVSSKTHFLINNDLTSKSSKNTKANQLGIPIISEAEFISRFGE